MDLSTSIEYRKIFRVQTSPVSAYLRRKHGNKITPNYDSTRGYGNQFSSYSFNYADMTYSDYKKHMLDRVRQCESSTYGGMIVNRGGHPKTNTTETCYRHLRRMIKDGLLRMINCPTFYRMSISVLVTVK